MPEQAPPVVRHNDSHCTPSGPVATMLILTVTLWILASSLSSIPPLVFGHRSIAFVTDRDGNWEIYVMSEDGSQQRRLTNHPAEDWLPAWSPDGSWLAFVSNRHGDWEILVQEVKGPGQGTPEDQPIRLTGQTESNWDPAWSPSGDQIAFSAVSEGHRHVYVMTLANADPARFPQVQGLVQVTDSPADDWLPAWSPDGQRLAFVTDRDGNWEIYVTAAPGVLAEGDQTENMPRNWTHHPANDWVPAWSPDGRYLAFQSDRTGDWEIFLMSVAEAESSDGKNRSNVINLTQHPANDWDPSWSADGRHLVFMSERDGNRELYRMAISMETDRPAPRGIIRLTMNDATDKNPAWSP